MTDKTLILVTRSGPDGQALCRHLRAQQLPACHFSPVALAGPEDPVDCRDQLLAALPVDRVVAPSAEALRQCAGLVGADTLDHAVVIVPGAGTARQARSLGFDRVAYPAAGGTSEDILELPELQQMAGQRVLILAAAGGRRQIERTLAERGAEVHRLHVYQRLRQLPPPGMESRLQAAADPIVLLASGGALEALQTVLSPACWQHLRSGLVVAPSMRVARLASAAGWQQVAVATGADHAAMLTALADARNDLDLCVTLE